MKISSRGEEAREESIKILRSQVSREEASEHPEARPAIQVSKKGVKVLCGTDAQGWALDILEVQPVGKKAMGIAAFVNGLQNKTVSL